MIISNILLFLIYLYMIKKIGKVVKIFTGKDYKLVKKNLDKLISETLEHHKLLVTDDQYTVILGVFAYHLNVIQSSGKSKDFASYHRYVVHAEDIKYISSSNE